MTPELLIFDNDGVLVDSEPLACAGSARAFQRLGIAIDEHELARRYVGMSAASMYADIEARHGVVLSPADRQGVADAVDALLAAEVTAMPGVDAALTVLARTLRLCVASSGTPRRIEGSLRRAGLWGHFNDERGGRVFSATQVKAGKPAPDLFLFAAAQMGVAPERCLVIEDSLPGVQAAVAAGMRCLGFTGGGHVSPRASQWAQVLLQARAVDTLAAMAQLPAWVLRLGADAGAAH